MRRTVRLRQAVMAGLATSVVKLAIDVEHPRGRRAKLNENPRTRYAAAVRRACEEGDLVLVRRLFAEASREVFTLRGLLPREEEIVLGRVLTPRYQAGASLLLLAAEIGRSTQYVAKVLRLAGVTIRPPYRPVMTTYPVDLAELRRQYEAGASVSGLARRIHYCRESTRKYLLRAGTQLRPNPAAGSPY